MLCVICISRGGSASVSFSEVEERSVDLRHMAAVATQREPTCDVGPNIIGTVPSGSMIAAYEPTGCFSRGSEAQASYEGGSGANRPLLFDATRSSEIYGLSTTVQPSAMNALVCIKI